jgi:periplasmic protein TonB
MKNFEKNANRSSNSVIYFQIGLVASLFLAYLFIELKLPDNENEVVGCPQVLDITEEPMTDKFRVESKPVVQIIRPKIIQPVLTFKPIEDTKPDPVDDTKLTTPDDILSPIATVHVVNTPPTIETPAKPEVYEKDAIEEKPTFFACQGLKGVAKDACFNEQMKKFLLQNLKYPAKAQNNDVEGRILVEFIIDSGGNVTSVKPMMVRNANNPDLEKEALRVIGKLPKMKPGKQGNEAVNVRYTIPISFKLPD